MAAWIMDGLDVRCAADRPSVTAAALADIPAELLPIYQEAAEATCGMRWAVLAAVGKDGIDGSVIIAGSFNYTSPLGGTWWPLHVLWRFLTGGREVVGRASIFY